MVRDLDLKKPPSIAESIDWARALLLLGAEDIDAETFRDTMSIIVKHRTDLDVVAERVGVKLGLPRTASVPPLRASSTGGPSHPRGTSRRAALFGGTPQGELPGGLAAHILEFGEELRGEGVAVGTSELLDAFSALPEVEWTEPRAFREVLAATLAKSPDDRRDLRPRLRPLLLPRRRARRRPGGRARGRDGRQHGRRPATS